ncbi:diguanylate cyclase [Desulfosarcina sp. OttesenSCG-928-G10]|nr:diguanylate cyclase [Desulfosarcina sp. OttesenSCG-928-G10]MDL2321146.1 diguanylate cyclase [Desulfosarcina sp. OttesenSCG-928-B08]
MKIAFPVEANDGLSSKVYGHFGSAPLFIFMETETGTFSASENPDQHHEHGFCNPMAALGGQKVDTVVVGGIGGGALKKLTDDGIAVYKAVEGTVDQNARLLKEGKLKVFETHHTCGHHHGVQIGDGAPAGGCAHH